MFKWIFNIFKKIKNNEVKSLSLETQKTKIYLNDPSTPFLFTEVEVPKETKLKINSIGDFGGGFEFGTPQQQASACKGMIDNILNYLISKTPREIRRWATTNTLTVITRAGEDINAFYDRGSLKFFYFEDSTVPKTIFACDSRSVVCHEFGHAFLDIIRPDLWSVQASEVWAFHEAFGDIASILENLQHKELIQFALEETKGDLNKSNIISRMAAEMGIGVFNLSDNKETLLPNCLRDSSIVYEYKIPEKLPTQGPDNEVINECHSFGRIFSNAFYEMILKIYQENKKNGIPDLEALEKSRDVCTSYLIEATMSVPVTVRFFSAMAKMILQIDRKNGGKYQEILNDIFVQRKIITASVKMLDNRTIEDLKKEIKEPFEIEEFGKEKILKVNSNKTIKFKDIAEIVSLNYNPLFELEIEIPNQYCYHFDENSNLKDIVQSQDTEIIEAAFVCLDYLNSKNLVGNLDNSLFEIKDEKLVRKQISCSCGRNECDPNAPEYGKQWKPANNAGCVACHSKNCQPRSCDCQSVEKTIPPKLGCYTKTKIGGTTSYKVGQSISRKVC
ncbi:MAG: hypothetical protein EKK64_03335 [Neisseriaceae bacterium]|nr:MAG: hypothetical protein EKK64_03335 [Neisseriaceae bacterium]